MVCNALQWTEERDEEFVSEGVVEVAEEVLEEEEAEVVVAVSEGNEP